MNLLTKELIKEIPKLYETENIEDKICHVKLFNPYGVGTWYIVEYDEETKEAFGYVEIGSYPELTYFSLDELEAYRHSRFGLGIERDLHFKPKSWSEIEGE
ncbi:MAG: DUF2958 domain-containing protein [Bacilli bacterium]|nr:DUF2958 domain-containing protein [Bacilli bacterium]